jgi:transposase
MKSSKTVPTKPTDWREGRRMRAWELYGAGWNQTKIAQALGVSQGTVSQWLKRARQGGMEALRRRPARGRAPKLTPEQRARLPELLKKGAEYFGFNGAVWTGKRVAQVIDNHFGVRYHPEYIPRLLGSIGWSLQKPARRAIQRDEAKVQRWKQEEWSALKKRL